MLRYAEPPSPTRTQCPATSFPDRKEDIDELGSAMNCVEKRRLQAALQALHEEEEAVELAADTE